MDVIQTGMPEFNLRPAVAGDTPVIRDLIHRVGINPMDLDWRHFIVAESSGSHFLGCGQLKQHRDGSLELASLVVETAYRGQGVARAIIEHILAHSPRPLYLMCRPSLDPFYQKFGFQVIQLEAMPPYFRRIRRLINALVLLTKHTVPSVMRLD